MRKVILAVILSLAVLCPAFADSKKVQAICSVKEVVIDPEINQTIVEHNTWLNVVDKQGPNTGRLSYSGAEKGEVTDVNPNTVGSVVLFHMVLTDATGKEVWRGLGKSFEGTVMHQGIKDPWVGEIHPPKDFVITTPFCLLRARPWHQKESDFGEDPVSPLSSGSLQGSFTVRMAC